MKLKFLLPIAALLASPCLAQVGGGIYNPAPFPASTGTGNVVLSNSPAFTGTVTGAASTWSGNVSAAAFLPTGSTVPTNGLYLAAANNPIISSNSGPGFSVGYFAGSGSPVNYLGALNVGAGFFPVLESFGSDTNPGIVYVTKGSGTHAFNTNGPTSNGTTQLSITHTASAVDSWNFTGAAAANPGLLLSSATGSDTNITQRFTPKGVGTVDFAGHISSSGTTPAIGACGTGTPSVSGTDNKGVITTGTGAPTSCAITFGKTYPSSPVCVVTTSASTSVPSITAVGTGGFTVGLTVGLTSGSIYYICVQ